jgi:hypothetical protein
MLELRAVGVLRSFGKERRKMANRALFKSFAGKLVPAARARQTLVAAHTIIDEVIFRPESRR